MSNRKTYLSAYRVDGKRKDVTADNMIAVLKFAATTLDYLYLKDIPVNTVNIHFLRYGGANALSLAGYNYRDIQKWGNGEGKPSRNIYERDCIVLMKACWLQ